MKRYIFFCGLVMRTLATEVYLDGVIVSVDNMPILYSDVKNVAMAIKYDKNNTKGVSEVDILKDLIDQYIIISSNTDVNIEKEQKLLESGVREQANMIFEKYFKNNEEEFMQQLGCNLEDYIRIGIENQKKQLLYTRILDNKINKHIFSQAEIHKVYEHLKKKNKLPEVEEHFELYQIVLHQKPSEEVQKIVDEVVERIDNESFDAVVNDRMKYNGLKFQQDSSWNNLNDRNAEFESVVFGLKQGDVSRPVKIDDIVYFIRLDEKDKTKYKTSILYIVDNVYKSDTQKAFDDLNTLRQDILAGKITWVDAVKLFSQDKNKNLYGHVTNDNGSIELKKKDISLAMRQAVKKTKVHSVSEPFKDSDAFKIVYISNHVEKHIANEKNDYNLFENLALQQYKKEMKDKILNEAYKDANIRFDNNHPLCRQLKKKYNIV